MQSGAGSAHGVDADQLAANWTDQEVIDRSLQRNTACGPELRSSRRSRFVRHAPDGALCHLCCNYFVAAGRKRGAAALHGIRCE